MLFKKTAIALMLMLGMSGCAVAPADDGVGSNSNVGENGRAVERNRAAILEVDIATGESRIYADGLRNPVGLAWAPDGQALFAEGKSATNRKPLNGYKVVFVRFQNGRPTGKPRDVLTGFLSERNEARGRPAGLALTRDGNLLVADDVGNRVWLVRARR